jgi:PAS domain S-box-containing protein
VSDRRSAQGLDDTVAALAAIVEASDDAIVATAPDGTITRWNHGAERMFGHAASEVVGRSVTLIVPEDLHDVDAVLRAQILAGERVERVETERLRKDGRRVAVSVNAGPIRDGAGRVTGIAMVVRDVGAFRALVESAPDAIVIADTHGRIELVNAQTERLFGYRRQDLVGQPVETLVPERYRGAHTGHRTEFAARPAFRPMGAGLELYGRRRDGTEFPVEISLSPLETEQGTLVASAIRDATERKRAEAARVRLIREQAAREEAEAANRMKDEFLITLSHELRTPLNAIIGWASLLRQGHLAAGPMEKALATIDRNARTLVQLIEDLLDVSRIITGKLRLEMSPVDLARVVDASVDIVRPAAVAKGIRIDTVLARDATHVTGDPARLQQIVWNLLSNAVKFTPPGGRVTVRVERGDDAVRVQVIDNGQGIDPVFLPHVFDRFRQADSTTTRTHGGLGLGLAIVRHLVELHGGTVAAESEGDGRGATFTIALPAPRASGAALEPAGTGTAPSAPLHGLRILVVDDQADERELFRTILTTRGADVRVAEDAHDAIEAFVDFRPDVLVTDVAMPGEDGYTLLAKVRGLDADGSRVPAVAVTAHARVEDRRRALLAGFEAYVSKPVEPDRLVDLVSGLGRQRC